MGARGEGEEWKGNIVSTNRVRCDAGGTVNACKHFVTSYDMSALYDDDIPVSP